MKQFFTSFSNFVAKWTGSHWAFFIAGFLVVVMLSMTGVDNTNISISVVTMLMLFVLQNTQNRDSAALHLKLDEVITHLRGPRDEIAGIESKSDEELEELRKRTGDHVAGALKQTGDAVAGTLERTTGETAATLKEADSSVTRKVRPVNGDEGA